MSNSCKSTHLTGTNQTPHQWPSIKGEIERAIRSYCEDFFCFNPTIFYLPPLDWHSEENEEAAVMFSPYVRQSVRPDLLCLMTPVCSSGTDLVSSSHSILLELWVQLPGRNTNTPSERVLKTDNESSFRFVLFQSQAVLLKSLLINKE